MNFKTILAEIDAEITHLQKVRALLSSDAKIGKDGPFPIRAARKRRKLSADARKRIADAQRKRWAAQKRKESATK
jgi:hypothetical protein